MYQLKAMSPANVALELGKDVGLTGDNLSMG